jgi:pilus assembly protein Flp/PilA
MKQAIEYYIAKFGIDQEGATAVEYGIMVALIAVAIILAVSLVGDSLIDLFTDVSTELDARP